MPEIQNAPLEGIVTRHGGPVVFELTIGQYEDMQVLGEFATRDEALQALGQWLIDHPDASSVYPAIVEP